MAFLLSLLSILQLQHGDIILVAAYEIEIPQQKLVSMEISFKDILKFHRCFPVYLIKDLRTPFL